MCECQVRGTVLPGAANPFFGGSRRLVVSHLLRGDVPDPVAEEGLVKGKCTEGSDDEDREQRPYRCSVHAFDGLLPNRHSVEVLMLWGHKAPLCLLAIAR